MKLQKIDINRGWSGDDPLRGSITFKTPEKHEFQIELTELDAQAIIEICAARMAEIGREATQALTAHALQVNALEHKDANFSCND